VPAAEDARDDDPFVDLAVTATTARATVRRAHAERLCIGHFPGDPLLPGAFLAGLLADLGARLVATAEDPPAKVAEIVRCVFRRRVRPDDDIVLFATRGRAPDAVEAEARTGRGLAAVATFRFVMPS
jgi:3-hydroxymyristoyl/3-hydroxydecanoyl-(acyl carrier protein) dehydratase